MTSLPILRTVKHQSKKGGGPQMIRRAHDEKVKMRESSESWGRGVNIGGGAPSTSKLLNYRQIKLVKV